MTQAFTGIKILDFSQVLAAPFAVMQLALLGAEVIKIEQPGSGDQMRHLINEGPDIGMSPSFIGTNVNKRSLTLNLREPAAVDIARKLIGQSDVLVESFKAGTMARYGLGFEDVKTIKPDIIYCSVTGYGQEGPQAGAAAYDGAIQASSGMMSQTGHPETGPTRTGFLAVDMSTGLNAALAIAAAIHRKTTTGLGQHLDVAMMDTAILMQATQYNNYNIQGVVGGLLGNDSQTGLPTANLFPTRDGFIQITAILEAQVEKLFVVLGKTEALKLPEFQSNDTRKQHPKLVYDFIADTLLAETTGHWMAQLDAAAVPAAEVRGIPEVVADPQFETREVFETTTSPIDSNETITIVKAGYTANEDGPTIRHPAPQIGEHSEQILSELGYSQTAINEFRENGVI